MKPGNLIQNFIPPLGIQPCCGLIQHQNLRSIASTPAMATRRFCPPDSSKGDFGKQFLFHPYLAQRLPGTPLALLLSQPLIGGTETYIF